LNEDFLKKLFSLFQHNDHDQAFIDANAIKQLEKKLQYKFSEKKYLIQSLKHRSILNITKEERIESNERLEFLGDAVVNLAVTHFLYDEYPDMEEGVLSKRKAILVSREVLAIIAQMLDLGEFVFLTRGEEKTGGRSRTSILANVYEAIVGAIYLDSGYKEAKKFIFRTLWTNHKKYIQHEEFKNYKSRLLEFAQKNQLGLPSYKVIREEGPDHDKTFFVEVSLKNTTIGKGSGKSKKQAEQHAANDALKNIKKNHSIFKKK
jgi:ribonuclease-3